MTTKRAIYSFLFLLLNCNWLQANTLVAKVPFELFGEHIFFKLKVQDSESLDFIFDTGAGATIVNTSTAKNMELQSSDATQVMGAGGMIEMLIFEETEVFIDGKRLLMAQLIGANLNKLERAIGRKIDGIIGKDLLDRYIIKVNYTNYCIEIYAHHAFQYQGKGSKQEIEFINGIPSINLNMYLKDSCNSIDGKYLMDTGAGLAVVFATPYAKTNHLIDIFPSYYISETSDITNLKSRGYNSILESVKFLGFKFPEMPVLAMDANHGVYSWRNIAGMLGNEVLKRFNITYNYKSKCTYWEKNTLYGEQFNIDCSGIGIEKNLETNEVVVTEVITDSPAHNSGLQLFDAIVQVDNISVEEIPLPKIKRMLRKENTEIDLQIRRNGEVKNFKLLLKRW